MARGRACMIPHALPCCCHAACASLWRWGPCCQPALRLPMARTGPCARLAASAAARAAGLARRSGARPPGWMKRAAARALLGAGARQLLRADCVQLHDCCNLRRRCPPGHAAVRLAAGATPATSQTRRGRGRRAGWPHGTTSRRAAGTRTTAGAQTEEQAAAAHACPRAHPYACKINSSSRTPMTPARGERRIRSPAGGAKAAVRRRERAPWLQHAPPIAGTC